MTPLISGPTVAPASALSSFVSSVFYFYSQVVGAYAIGRYYYANKEAIGWFGGR